MTAALATLALAAFVALAMLANSKLARCKMRGHDWSRPWTDDGRRVERCDRCYVVRDHVFAAPKAERFDTLAIDGTAPVSFVVSPRVVEPEPVEVTDEIKARREEIKARVHAKHGRVSTESKVQS